MKRHLFFSLALLSLIAVFMTGCRGPSAQAQANVPTNTPVAAPHGGPVTDYVSLLDSLRAAGATVEPAGEIEQPFLSVSGQQIKVNGSEVQVFEYVEAASADTDAAQIGPEGSSAGTTMITWIATPHWYKTGKLVVLYLGDDGTMTTLLESMLGMQFAGG